MLVVGGSLGFLSAPIDSFDSSSNYAQDFADGVAVAVAVETNNRAVDDNVGVVVAVADLHVGNDVVADVVDAAFASFVFSSAILKIYVNNLFSAQYTSL